MDGEQWGVSPRLLRLAAMQGDIRGVASMLATHAPWHDNLDPPVSSRYSVLYVRQLTSHRAWQGLALCSAVKKGQVEVVEYLLGMGYGPDAIPQVRRCRQCSKLSTGDGAVASFALRAQAGHDTALVVALDTPVVPSAQRSRRVQCADLLLAAGASLCHRSRRVRA